MTYLSFANDDDDNDDDDQAWITAPSMRMSVRLFVCNMSVLSFSRAGEGTLSNLISRDKLGQKRPQGRRLCRDEDTSDCPHVPPIPEYCTHDKPY